jgi:hypothetical protein
MQGGVWKEGAARAGGHLAKGKKERKTYARCQACVKGALASKSWAGGRLARGSCGECAVRAGRVAAKPDGAWRRSLKRYQRYGWYLNRYQARTRGQGW